MFARPVTLSPETTPVPPAENATPTRPLFWKVSFAIVTLLPVPTTATPKPKLDAGSVSSITFLTRTFEIVPVAPASHRKPCSTTGEPLGDPVFPPPSNVRAVTSNCTPSARIAAASGPVNCWESLFAWIVVTPCPDPISWSWSVTAMVAAVGSTSCVPFESMISSGPAWLFALVTASAIVPNASVPKIRLLFEFGCPTLNVTTSPRVFPMNVGST
jgi:hypothetical protein